MLPVLLVHVTPGAGDLDISTTQQWVVTIAALRAVQQPAKSVQGTAIQACTPVAGCTATTGFLWDTLMGHCPSLPAGHRGDLHTEVMTLLQILKQPAERRHRADLVALCSGIAGT